MNRRYRFRRRNDKFHRDISALTVVKEMSIANAQCFAFYRFPLQVFIEKKAAMKFTTILSRCTELILVINFKTFNSKRLNGNG